MDDLDTLGLEQGLPPVVLGNKVVRMGVSEFLRGRRRRDHGIGKEACGCVFGVPGRQVSLREENVCRSNVSGVVRDHRDNVILCSCREGLM